MPSSRYTGDSKVNVVPTEPSSDMFTFSGFFVTIEKGNVVLPGYPFTTSLISTETGNDASFVLRNGETLGVVGESGSGKSTLAKTLIRLEEPTSGTVKIRDEDFLSLSGKDLIYSRKKIQMIFQDPFGSLNPSQTVGFMLTRGLELQGVEPDVAR